jgi:hypothetical protein
MNFTGDHASQNRIALPPERGAGGHVTTPHEMKTHERKARRRAANAWLVFIRPLRR